MTPADADLREIQRAMARELLRAAAIEIDADVPASRGAASSVARGGRVALALTYLIEVSGSDAETGVALDTLGAIFTAVAGLIGHMLAGVALERRAPMVDALVRELIDAASPEARAFAQQTAEGVLH